MTKKKISVVMGTYNQCEILKKVLPFYEKQVCSKEEYEVIVVDSSSTDGSQEFLKSYSPDYSFKAHIQENEGKASARNKGVELAEGDIIIITDSDMIPSESFVSAHLRAHESSPSPRCFEGLAWNLPSLEWPPKKELLSPQVGTHPKSGSKLGWYYFLTGNLSIPKSLFNEEKGFNRQFLGYGWEDLELGYRLSKRSIPLIYLRESVNYHYHVISEEEEIARNIKKGESAQIFLTLHPELKWFLGLNPISKFIFPRISQSGALYKWLEKSYESSKNRLLNRFAFWFLKEFNYLKGILAK